MAWAAAAKAALTYAKPILAKVGRGIVEEGISQGVQSIAGQQQSDSWLGDDKTFNPPQKSNLGQGANAMNPAQRGANQVYEGLADAAADKVLSMFAAPGAGQDFSTQQTTDARNENQGFGASKSREQLQYEDQMSRDRAVYDDQLARGRADFTADLGNRAANANTARGMAMDTTQNLNRMYATAGDRLNQAAANTQGALNNAAATIAGLFR